MVHLDGRVLHLCCDKMITPQLEKRISGEGMRIPNNDPLAPITNAYERGDLIVRFNILFPKKLSDGQKEQIDALLS